VLAIPSQPLRGMHHLHMKLLCLFQNSDRNIGHPACTSLNCRYSAIEPALDIVPPSFSSFRLTEIVLYTVLFREISISRLHGSSPISVTARSPEDHR
jgi:hypothetical protein